MEMEEERKKNFYRTLRNIYMIDGSAKIIDSSLTHNGILEYDIRKPQVVNKCKKSIHGF